MSDLETLEKQDISKHPPIKTVSRGWRWQWLIAPLMGCSLLLHMALLFVPLPSLAPAAEETTEEEAIEADEAAPIDILSLSDIAVPEPESLPEPPSEPSQQPQQPAPAPQPQPTGTVPSPPQPEQIENAPPQDTSEDVLPEEDDLGQEDATGAFDPARQSNLAGSGRANLSSTEFGKLNSGDPGLIAALILQQGLKDGVNPDCFFAEINPQRGLTPVQNVIDTVTVARNIDFVPDALCSAGYCTAYEEIGNFCNAPLYQLLDNGSPQFFASLLEPGGGGSVVVSLWTADPRQ